MSGNDANQSGRSSLGSNNRKLRYRELLEELTTIADEVSDNAVRMEKTENVVHEAKVLLADGGIEERVQHPDEGYLDSKVLRATSDLAIQCSEAVSGNINAYNWQDLAQHISENESFWEFTFPREVPPVAYLYGTFAPTPPEQRPRAPRRRVERQQLAPAVAPETVDRLDKMEEGYEMVNRVKKFINSMYKSTGQKPLSYFHVVLDPESFSRTIENIYHVSFLVRDGWAAVNLDEEHKLPFISPRSSFGDDQGDISDENQFIVSMDTKRWRDLVEAFGIRKPMMVLKR